MFEKDRKSYLISGQTNYLSPVYNEYGELCADAGEQFQEVKVLKSPKKIIHENCLYFGSCYKGRVKAAGDLFPGQKMLPICINELLHLYFAPTASPESDTCIWIGCKNFKSAVPYNGKCMVMFTNGKSLYVPLSPEAVQARIDKASRMMLTLLIRHKKLQQEALKWQLELEENFYLPGSEEVENGLYLT
ncbi:competence protein ComK [Metabacillus sp. GX 13764]|uniref:competence protein ComK n=1 Tax=Metabacillus kandeliae TaxID=2900151 RepID=UPI001E2FABAF|nr:competence protein ComK [Metabacillus kandeliae]MCD7034511.1 competence protein ComK [Metabacillus kandeliae]